MDKQIHVTAHQLLKRTKGLIEARNYLAHSATPTADRVGVTPEGPFFAARLLASMPAGMA
jgi:hypothetical protein